LSESVYHPSWTHLHAGAPLRPYQRRAVEALTEALKERPRACLVAPPGAGKTRCALHVAAALGRPVEVLVPTTALAEQWRARVRTDLVSVGPEHAPPPEAPISVQTYAAERPFAPGALVILDEAHHVTASWGRSVEDRLDARHRVLGLTGTPPEGSGGWDRFLKLVGTEPVIVETPPLVRDRHLCPYQDLVWPVAVDLDDAPGLREVDRAIAEVEEAHRVRMGAWEAGLLKEDLWALTEARFARQEGLLVALCRLRHARGQELPADLPRDPELTAPPTLHDRALALWAFGEKDPPVRSALKTAGFKPGKSGPVLVDDRAWKSLAASFARVRGAVEVLEAERAARGDGLRALVLTDRDAEADRISARQVLKALAADRRTDPLDPVLVTGSVFWVDDDLWPRIRDRLPELPWTAAGDHHEIDTTGWPTAERVALATRLLSEGVTRCLIGTRHLLGEGWDCPPVNVVIDLTGIVAPVTVNQIRGRALRPDPGDPSKVASLWDVIALAPGAIGGDRMLERLRQRHKHTLGIDPGGRIIAGVRRIDPALEQPLPDVAADMEGLQSRMRARTADGIRAAELWAVGRAYKDRRAWRLEGKLPGPARVPREIARAAIAEQKLLEGGRASIEVRGRRSRWIQRGLAVGLTGAGVAGAALAAPLLGPAALGVLAVGAVAGGVSSRIAAVALGRQMDRETAALTALRDALHKLSPDTGPLCSEGERRWVEGPPEASRRFAEAAAELMGPVRYPRYLLLEPDGQVWPVPGELGASRGLADDFARHWAATVGPCEVIFARKGRGRELLRAAWRAAGREPVQVIEAWE
jgi:superfamily II DNA or RNA helicase